jgi:hypothetical protein
LTPFPIKLDFVRALTDDVGILQHSKYATPNKKKDTQQMITQEL